MRDADVRTILQAYTGRYGSPIACLQATGEITEHTRAALLERAVTAEANGHDTDADLLRDIAGYVLAVGYRPPVTDWTTRYPHPGGGRHSASPTRNQ